MSETGESPDRIYFNRAKSGSLPPLGKEVLVETRNGEWRVAVRYENPANKNTYFWGLPFTNSRGKKGVIGKLNVDVVNWYE